MRSIKFLLLVSLVMLGACKKEDDQEYTPPDYSNLTYHTNQYLTKSGTGASANSIHWVIEGDTLKLGQCYPSYEVGDYYKSFNFEVGKEYDFKILRRLPASTIYEVKNEGTIKFIDGTSSTDLYGGVSSVVFTQGSTWTYSILYGQCGSIDNQLVVMIP